jgi:hypothetical protein
MKRTIPHSHRMTRQEAAVFMKEKYNIEVME